MSLLVPGDRVLGDAGTFLEVQDVRHGSGILYSFNFAPLPDANPSPSLTCGVRTMLATDDTDAGVVTRVPLLHCADPDYPLHLKPGVRLMLKPFRIWSSDGAPRQHATVTALSVYSNMQPQAWTSIRVEGPNRFLDDQMLVLCGYDDDPVVPRRADPMLEHLLQVIWRQPPEN